MSRSSTLSWGTGLQNGLKKICSLVHIARPGARARDLVSREGGGGDGSKSPRSPGSIDSLHDSASLSSSSIKTSAAGEFDQDSRDGGIRAWLVVSGCWLALFAALGFMNILSTFQAYLATTWTADDLSPGAVGGAIFAYAFLSFLLGLYVGPLFDKHGPRWLILGGTVSLVASLLLASVVDDDAAAGAGLILAALAILGSLGSTLLYVPSVAAVARVFSAHRGLAIGLATTSTSASGLVFPPLLHALFVRVGWAWAVRAIALFCLALTVAANFLITRAPGLAAGTKREEGERGEEKEPKEQKEGGEKAAAAAPAGGSSSSRSSPRPLRARIIFGGVGGGGGRVSAAAGFAPTVGAVLCAQLGSSLALSYLPRYALGRAGLGRAEAFEVVAVANGASVAGRVLAGWAADRLGPFDAGVGCCAAAALASLGVWLPAGGTKGGVMSFAAVFGVASGGGVSLAPVVVGRLCDAREYGRYYGTCHAVTSFLVMLAVPVAEQVFDGGEGRHPSLVVVTGVLYVLAAVAFAAARVVVAGRRLRIIC
ncbi:major facilitator superfamily domain-containing protein [Thermothelomyces heterothallicus CBS 202.75]|uniref:major facilitator superfamily domain-containing protein n=1 Tax=Thermothelomyces heterothallicus CBS 202.75 TaxID=1149848 RepID=UPI0037433ECE